MNFKLSSSESLQLLDDCIGIQILDSVRSHLKLKEEMVGSWKVDHSKSLRLWTSETGRIGCSREIALVSS